MKVVCAHQPDFLPYLGFFDRVARSDAFVIMDDVQLIRRGWHYRNRIKGPQGPMWISVPVLRKGRTGQPIRDARIDETQHWREYLLKALRFNYGHAPAFAALYPRLEAAIREAPDRLVDLNMALLRLLLEWFRLDVPLLLASDLHLEGKANEYLIAAVRAAGGDVYLSGTGARDYLDEAMFRAAGLQVVWQEFVHPEYPQLHGPFVPSLSAVDLVLNCGDRSPEFVRPPARTAAPPGGPP